MTPETPPEHPAVRAARMIRAMHVETVEKIDAGIAVHQKRIGEVLVDCNAEIRAACAEQIVKCDEIIERANGADAESWSPPAFVLNNILADTQEAITKKTPNE